MSPKLEVMCEPLVADGYYHAATWPAAAMKWPGKQSVWSAAAALRWLAALDETATSGVNEQFAACLHVKKPAPLPRMHGPAHIQQQQGCVALQEPNGPRGTGGCKGGLHEILMLEGGQRVE